MSWLLVVYVGPGQNKVTSCITSVLSGLLVVFAHWFLYSLSSFWKMPPRSMAILANFIIFGKVLILHYNNLMQYDRFQQEAINHINQGQSVIVCAPTGAGKTAIAEYIIQQALNQQQNIIYTAPIKALSNQKFRDFQKQFPGKIGILTGDVCLNPEAQVLIMTTEIFRNKILFISYKF